MNIKDLTIYLHNCGFNVVPCYEKRPYVPLGTGDPYLYQHLKADRLDIERLFDAMKNIEAEGKEYRIGILPGEIKEGKYQGYNSWAIDIDDPQNIEILNITLEKCKEKGIWFEKSRKGFHLYGISKDKVISEKNHDLKLELFGEGSFIVVYGNFESDLYELQSKEINKDYQFFKRDVGKELGINTSEKKPLTEIKIGVRYGERNTSAFKLACDYKDKGLSIEETTKLMMDWNRNNNPPLHDRELINCIKSAYKRPAPPQPEKEIKLKQELLNEYKVFYVDEKGNNRISCPRLAKLIMNSDDNHYLVIFDNQEILWYNRSYYEHGGEKKIEQRINYYLDDRMCSRYKAEVLTYIKTKDMIKRDELEPPVHLINLKNGVFNLETKELLPHEHKYLFLNEIPINYDQNAKIDKIQTFLEETLDVNDIPLIQEFFGDCLQRSYSFKRAIMCVGERDTGKSQLLLLLDIFLGKDNTSNVNLWDLCTDRFASIELYHKLANTCSELDPEEITHVDKFLSLTGGDWQSGQKKHQDRFKFINYAKIIFGCNKIPDTKHKNEAFYVRWIVIVFSNIIPFEDQIEDYYSIIATEKELSGLLNWALEGLYRLKKNHGYSEHRSLDEVRELMQKGTNTIREFVEAYIDGDPNNSILKGDLYLSYVDFCKFMGYPFKTDNVFSRKFKPELKHDIVISECEIHHKKAWSGIKCTWTKGIPQEKLKCQ